MSCVTQGGISVYKRSMSSAKKLLTDIAWTPGLAAALANASAAVATLDARVSNSLLATAWQKRAKLSGYAAALYLQNEQIDEVDVFSHFCGLRLPGRAIPETNSEPYAEFAKWEALLHDGEGRHWRQALPFTFDLPQGWEGAPKLVRSLVVLHKWTSVDMTKMAWLQGPILLQQFRVTNAVLPNLVFGNAAMRSNNSRTDVLLRQLLTDLRKVAEVGLARFDAMEDATMRFANIVAKEKRLGKLKDLGLLLLIDPLLTPRRVADYLGLTVSGAGKLLQRAAKHDIVSEVSGRGTWRAYATRDIAMALNLIEPKRGRPHKIPKSCGNIGQLVDELELVNYFG